MKYNYCITFYQNGEKGKTLKHVYNKNDIIIITKECLPVFVAVDLIRFINIKKI